MALSADGHRYSSDIAPPERRVALLARAPSENGKTRLTVGESSARAQALREALLLDTLAAARSAGYPVTIFGTPADRLSEVAALVARIVTDRTGVHNNVPVLPQVEGDLGMRMHRACTCLFEQGARHLVLIGSDLPTLPPAHVREAFDALERGIDVVLGPAEDGGYYLVGMSRPTRAVFAGISWGMPTVFEHTLAAAAAGGASVHQLPRWYDVDTRSDLTKVLASMAPATWTRRWVDGGGATSLVDP